jgi:hypothetical protein
MLSVLFGAAAPNPGAYLFEADIGIKPLMQKIRRAANLTLSDWRYLTIALAQLLAARIRVSTATAEKILRELQAPMSALPHGRRSLMARIDVERLSWALLVAAQHVPWRSDCLIKVIAADRWLRRHHISSDFYLGVGKDEQGIFTAHAWVRYGDLIVTGGGHEQFSTLIEPAAKNSFASALSLTSGVCRQGQAR